MSSSPEAPTSVASPLAGKLETSGWTHRPLDGVPALSIGNLEKTYDGGTRALKGVSLDIPAGDFYALLGPNGAGKTTIIGIVTGLVNKTGGTVSVFGDDIDSHPQLARKHIGVVPQELNFNVFEKVIDVVVNQAGYYGIPRKVAIPRAEELLRQLGLFDKRNDMSRTLSGGMKRRLMIARALVHRPRLLILDEPTAGVDVELRRGMWDFLKQLTAGGTTILLTTHYLEEAEQLCRHIAIINHGEIIASGTIRNILGRLQSETVLLDVAEGSAERAAEILRADATSAARAIDGSSVEFELATGHHLGEFVVALEREGIAVRMARGKTGRLEEVFMRLTSTAGGSSGS